MPKKVVKKNKKLARAIYKKYRRRNVRPEVKFIDVYTSSTVNTSGFVAYISAIAQGTDNNQRVGRSIQPLYYHVNARMYKSNGSSSPPPVTMIRYILFQDTESNAAAPAVADVLETVSIDSQYNITSSKGRFKFLHDKVWTFGVGQTVCKWFTYTHKSLLPIMYDGTGNTTASAGKNSLYALFISDQTSTEVPQIDFRHRLRYTDS